MASAGVEDRAAAVPRAGLLQQEADPQADRKRKASARSRAIIQADHPEDAHQYLVAILQLPA